MENSNVRVLLVPFPITPLVAFAYFVFRSFGLVSQDVEARYSTESDSHPYFTGGRIRRLDCPDLHRELEDYILKFGGGKRWLLKRVLDYCAYSEESGFRWCLLSFSSMTNPKPLLENAVPFFEECLQNKRDLWMAGWNEEKDRKFFPKTPSASVEIPQGFEKGRFHVLKTSESTEREVVKAASFQIQEGRVRFLEGEHVELAVVGPRSTGKSTFVFSLVSVMLDILQSLKSRVGLWGNISLEITRENLDLGTPTLVAIEQGFAHDWEKMQKLKKPWTAELASESFDLSAKAKAKPGLVIADLPGRVSRYTELAASLANVAVIVVGNREEEISQWREFCGNLGIKVVGEVRSRLQKEGLFSLITDYKPGKFVTARVAGMNRMDFSGDPAVTQMAKFLLLDILPSLVEERRKKAGKLLRLLWEKK